MLLEILLILLAGIVFLFWNFRQKTSYWRKMGVKQYDRVPFPFGDNAAASLDVFASKINTGDLAEKQYNDFPGEKYYGTYMLPIFSPTLNVKDPDIIRDIFVKDFSHFVDRHSVMNIFGVPGTKNKTDMAWQKQLSNAKGDDWKDIRSMFSPIFTSGKLRMMVKFIDLVSKDMVAKLEEAAKSGKEIEMKEVFGKFSMDTIASCVFGVDAGSFKAGKSGDCDSRFVCNAKEIFTSHAEDKIRRLIGNFPVTKNIAAALRFSVFKPRETQILYDILTQTIRHRINTKTRRNDLIDLMVDAMTKDLSADMTNNTHAFDQFERDAKFDHNSPKGQLDEVTIVATALIMLVAGYDTTAQTLSFIGYELARNPEIQTRLQEEIDEVFNEAREGTVLLDYDVVQNLPYLDMVIHEALRLHSPAGIISRACVKDYTIRGTNVTIKAGQEIYVNIQGIHRDPKNYPNPMNFNPENFSKEAKASRNPYTFLAFGQGPRSCIGMRFALLEAKIGVITVLKSYNFVSSPRTPKKLTRDPESILGNVLEPLYIKIEARQWT